MLRRKLLILVDWFVPGYKAGGPIRSTANVAAALKNDFDIYVLTTDIDHGETQPYEGIAPNTWTNKVVPGINVYYTAKKTISTKQIQEVIVNVGADIVYLNHLFSPMFVLYPLYLKMRGIIKGEMVVCPRGALYDSAINHKAYKKKPFMLLFKLTSIKKYIRFHATNQREKEAILRYFPGSNIMIADNLPEAEQPEFSSVEKTPGTLRCIFIARIVAIKNLLFLLRSLSSVETKVQLTIVGPAEDEPYWQQCQELIKTLPTNIQVEYLGSRSRAELQELIQSHHLFVLPTAGENFGHAIFEAFLAGRPVLISDQTPWLQLEEKGIGWDVPLADTVFFTKRLEEAAGWDQTTFNKSANNAWNFADAYLNDPHLKQQYLALFA